MDKAEKKPKITKEQAQILLEQAKMETEHGLKNNKDRGKRLIFIGVVLLVAAIVVAVVTRLMMEGLK